MKDISELSSDNWNGYRIERINKSHYPALSILLTTISRSGLDLDTLQKKYATDFLEQPNIGYVAFDNSLIISNQMGLLTQLCYKGKNHLAIQSCDSATHPNYSKQGLWAILNEKMFHQVAIENVTGVFGLPNQNSYPIAIKKLGYQAGGMFKNYSIEVHKTPFYKIANRLKFGGLVLRTLKKYQVSPISFSSFNDNDYLVVNRSLAYLNYKVQRGSFFIRLYDTIFWIKIRSGNLFIGDLKTVSEIDFDKSMKKLKSLCYWSGLKNIIFQTQEGSFAENLFAMNYPVMETMPLLYKIYNSEVPYHLLKCTYADLDTF